MNHEMESLVLVRHGLSLANLDPTLYQRVPDHLIALAYPDDDPGCEMAGRKISALRYRQAETCVWFSPYLRCEQTANLVSKWAFGNETDALFRRESFLLREHDFGHWDGLTDEQIEAQDVILSQKKKKLEDSRGKFYFRYPGGESRADVVFRLSHFVGKIRRSSFKHHLVFLHGVTQRALRMAWFNYPVEWFEREGNPDNASALLIERSALNGRWTERYL